jgi:DNA polymerase III subunit gamma/tau
MSYQVIARKWRPQAFEEVTGQEHITRTLRNAIEHDRLHHAYLFSGARGVGKTTTARLLAKALNCHKSEKPNTRPCRVDDPAACASCIEISESRSMDVLEIDAASHTGIDDVRETIIEGININPARDRYKVFIVDEVHQLSKPAFNALLKTLEEPPENVVFIMATTELHKVPDTILSRCQQFEFRTIAVQKIFERLKLIAQAEKISVSDEALKEIARSGEGSMRDAQSNFDQVISFSGEKIEVADVTIALGLAGSDVLTRVATAIAEKDAKSSLQIVDELISRGHDLRNFSRDLLGFFRDLLVLKVSGGEEGLVESAELSADEMQTFASMFSEADLLRFFNSLSETETRLKDATQSRYVLEMGLVRLIEMQRVAPVEKVLERLVALENGLRGGSSEPEISKAAASSATSEKKTLKSAERASPQPEPDIFPDEPPFPVSNSIPDLLEPVLPLTKFIADLGSVDALPVKLPPIPPEELEHAEDNWLDNAYEEKLARSGDGLAPIENASAMVAALVGFSSGSNAVVTAAYGNGHQTYELENPVFTPPTFDDAGTDTALPELPENPTEEQLLAYAQAHPRVKKAMRIFRAKIVEIKKR